MSATATPEATGVQTPTDAPPAKSWAVYTYNSSPLATAATRCHIFGYSGGSPLNEQQANDLAVKLAGSQTVMVLPVEDESAAPVPA